MAEEDYYEILGIDRNASPAEIKKAYRNLAIQYHPDRNPNDTGAEEKFKKAAEAYSVLGNPEKREEYNRLGRDRFRSSWKGFDHATFEEFSDILGDFLRNAQFFSGARAKPRQGKGGSDLRLHLEISLEEAAGGLTAPLLFTRMATCEDCSGKTFRPGTPLRECPKCFGAGTLSSQFSILQVRKTCPLCTGSGVLPDSRCPTCRGEGRLSKEKKLRLKIPPGVKNGTRILLKNQGDAGISGGPSGNLVVVVFVRGHSFFERREENLLCTIRVPFYTAALGGEAAIPTLEGHKAKILIPPGTQPGTTFRLKGRGLATGIPGRRGDLLASLEVVIPEAMSEEQKAHLKGYAALDGASVPAQEKRSPWNPWRWIRRLWLK